MTSVYDLAVVGSGFAGSLLATIARRLGRSVVLLESGKHPRFAIGESSTPLANLLLEQLSARYDLPAIAPLAKWGSWQQHYPNLTCGLKRGFSFFHHAWGEQFSPNPERSNELLVAASPHDQIADVHWYRADFDQFLAAEAQRAGVDFLDETKIENVSEHADFLELDTTRHAKRTAVRAKFVVDATGPRGCLHQALQLPEAQLPGFPKTQALYTHFEGVRPFPDSLATPYPINDAAVHHVFEGGWIWVLRFNNGLTSAGVAASDAVANRFNFAEGAPAWNRLLNKLPSVAGQFANAKPQRPFVHAPQLSFRSGQITGARWALLPSVAGFVDPLLSTGFTLTLLGILRLAGIFEQAHWQAANFKPLLQIYEEATGQELLAAARLVAALYSSMGDSALFSSLSLLYFAAASFSETARRLGKTTLASSFLLWDHPTFGPASRQLLDNTIARSVSQNLQDLQRAVQNAIDPVNVAGLGVAARRNWYPVDAEDLLSAADKLQSTRGEISGMLQQSGFWNQVA